MTRQPKCELIGKWRIVEADLWDKAYLDLVEPAHIIFRADGRGEIIRIQVQCRDGVGALLQSKGGQAP